MEDVRERWQGLFAQVFNDFSTDRILAEARNTLAAMNYRIEWDGVVVNVPPDEPLLVVRRSLHCDETIRLGGYFTFDVAVGPNFTRESLFDGTCEYGLLRLQFGLDDSCQDDHFELSPLWLPDEGVPEYEHSYEGEPMIVAVAERREDYDVGDGRE